MKYKFGTKSKQKLATCHPDLQRLFKEVIKIIDCSILCGHRSGDIQNALFDQGLSKLRYPDSKHNPMPSFAVDVAPWPIDWHDTKRFYYFAGIVKGVAESLNIEIRWGGDWDSDNDLNDQTFMDLVHFELFN